MKIISIFLICVAICYAQNEETDSQDDENPFAPEQIPVNGGETAMEASTNSDQPETEDSGPEIPTETVTDTPVDPTEESVTEATTTAAPVRTTTERVCKDKYDIACRHAQCRIWPMPKLCPKTCKMC